MSFATVAVTGLGAFVAAAVGVTLYVSAERGWRSTQALIVQQGEARLDALEQRVEAQLRPVREQAEGIGAALGEGRIDPARRAEFDAFMFGALGATPQVSDLALVDAHGRARRWSRGAPRALSEDWSARADVREWLERGRAQEGQVWRPLLWKPAARAPSLLHQVPLYRGGTFVGMLGQVVPIAKLSEDLALFGAEHDVTPFVLYGADRVLAHPALAQRREPGEAGTLPALAAIGDPVLERVRTPDGAALLARGLTRATGVRARVGDRHYVYIYRDIETHEREPWTIGLYFDPVQGGQRDAVLRMVWSIAAGLGVLLAAVALAALAGRRLGRPIEA
ncbi:MAG TPA: hypothetical protein VFU24_01980, partial [Burkholderiales bacterium]|nr:hypothetical protein [Burkholderiales bacterium]